MVKQMWDMGKPVPPEMVAEEIGVDLEHYLFDVRDVETEHVDMASSLSFMSIHNAEADVWRIRCVLAHKVFRNAREREVTVIQFESGGLSGGEGWATCNRYVVDAWLTDAELTGLLPLLEAGIVPQHTYFEEM